MSTVGSVLGMLGIGAGSGMEEEKKSFSALMKEKGSEAHANVEKTPIAQAMFKGTVTEEEYIGYLASMREIYEQLEIELVLNESSGFIKPLIVKGLFRLEGIKQDLKAFGAEGHEAHQLALEYKAHLLYLGQHQPHRLVAHAYLRFLGDLFGGMLIARKLSSKFEGKLKFYDFSVLCGEQEISSASQFAKTFREILDKLPIHEELKIAVLEEVEIGYQLHQKLFEALKD